MKKLTLLQSQK